MLQTTEFERLISRFALAEQILGDTPDHDFRNDLDRLRCRSYIFLCHAALEEYLEDLSLSILQKAYDQFSGGVISKPLVDACSFYQIRLSEVPNQSCAPLSLKRIIIEASGLAIRNHRAAIKGNNGIKTSDQQKLFLPIGFDIGGFDHVLSQKLNAYGERRGSIAHSFQINEQLPKAALQSEINLIKRLIKPFDEAADGLVQNSVFA